MMDSYQPIYDAVRSRISNGDVGGAIESVARNAFDISHVVERAQEQVYAVAGEMTRPSVLYRPSLYPDGNKWCALYGENLQDGIAGFGDTPAEAMEAFDAAFRNERCGKAARAIAAEDAQREIDDNSQFGVGA